MGKTLVMELKQCEREKRRRKERKESNESRRCPQCFLLWGWVECICHHPTTGLQCCTIACAARERWDRAMLSVGSCSGSL